MSTRLVRELRGFWLQETEVEKCSVLGFRIGSPVSCQGSGFVCVLCFSRTEATICVFAFRKVASNKFSRRGVLRIVVCKNQSSCARPAAVQLSVFQGLGFLTPKQCTTSRILESLSHEARRRGAGP